MMKTQNMQALAHTCCSMHQSGSARTHQSAPRKTTRPDAPPFVPSVIGSGRLVVRTPTGQRSLPTPRTRAPDSGRTTQYHPQQHATRDVGVPMLRVAGFSNHWRPDLLTVAKAFAPLFATQKEKTTDLPRLPLQHLHMSLRCNLN